MCIKFHTLCIITQEYLVLAPNVKNLEVTLWERFFGFFRSLLTSASQEVVVLNSSSGDSTWLFWIHGWFSLICVNVVNLVILENLAILVIWVNF